MSVFRMFSFYFFLFDKVVWYKFFEGLKNVFLNKGKKLVVNKIIFFYICM